MFLTCLPEKQVTFVSPTPKTDPDDNVQMAASK